MQVSKTPFSEAVSDEVYESLPEDLRESGLHGFNTAESDESVLLWGPPGTGKTTESVGRLAAYAAEHDLSPRDVTVVTYRKSLAADIKERVMDWDALHVPEMLEDMSEEELYKYFGTAHAVATRASGFFEGIGTAPEDRGDPDPHEGMVDAEAKRAFCKEVGITYKNGVIGRDSEWEVFHGLYTFCKQNMLDVGRWKHLDDDDLIGTVRTHETASQKLQEFNNRFSANSEFEAAVSAWESWKAEHDCHDFYEQLEAGLDARLPANEFVIIDELHDAYPLMVTLFERWIDAVETVVVAGDPNQVCNGFSGAHPAIFNGLSDRVDRDLPMVRLPKTHRVPGEHYAAASRILSRHHEPPVLETAGEGGIASYRPDETVSYDNSTEAWTPMHPETPGAPQHLVDKHGSDMMLLGRTRMIVDGIGAGLDAGGYVYRSQDGVAGNWTRRLNVLNALKLVNNVRPGIQGSLKNTEYDDTGGSGGALTPENTNRVLEPAEARVLIEHTHNRFLAESRSDILDTIGEIDSNDKPGDPDNVALTLLEEWVERKWWSVYGRGYDSIENLVRITAQKDFTGTRERDVIAMKRAWRRYDALPSLDDVDLKLWTIHAAKGDESEHAVIYTGVTGRVRDGVREFDENAANEARTWYVGLTRASHGLHVVHDAFDVTAGDFQWIPDDLVPVAIGDAQERRNNAARSMGDE